ncbi:MAG: MlaD family protein [Candidatus Binatia bacterium]|jgi:phospholipid/cholesterol/gamma-HCH transport system substrate-binding protein
MATEAHKFQVGLFVIIAVVIGLGAAIWLSATRFFEKTNTFVTYFSESVQGLDPGAPVKYRGVPAGRVARIEIAPDGTLIEVVMDVDTSVAKALKGDATLRTQLELSGITGLRYVEIDHHSGDALNQAPPLSFKPPCELIPSARSSFKAVQSALADVYDKVMALDLSGISADARATLQSANHLLSDQRVDTLLSNFAVASESTQRAAKNVEAMTAGVKIAPVVENATKATQDAKTLLADLKKGVNPQELRQTLDQLNQLTMGAQQFVIGLQTTLERLNRTVGSLQGLTEEVRHQPSLLLFGEPPAAQRVPEGGGQ